MSDDATIQTPDERPLQNPPPKRAKRDTRRRGNGEGSIFQRTNPDGSKGLWVGTISFGFNAQGKRRRRTVYGKTKGDVMRKLAKFQTDKAKGTLREASKLTVAQYLAAWLQDTARLTVKASTLHSYKGLVDREIVPRIGGENLSKLTKLHVKKLYSMMETDGKSPRARQMVHAVLRKALEDAVEDEIVPANVAASKKLRPKAPKGEAQFLTPSQAERFLEFVKGDRLHALYCLAVHSGLRQGELFGLTWADVDLDNGTVTVRRTLTELNGRLEDGTPKSKAGRRTVELPPVTIDALIAHKRQLLIEGNAGQPYVFCSPEGKRLRKSNVQRRSFKPILKRANDAARKAVEGTDAEPELLPDIPFHALRHTHATILLDQGVHPKLVQTRMGHSQIGLTLDTYSHVIKGMDRKASDAIAKAFAPKPQEPPAAAAGA